jgi:uncharacterized protein YjbJ (UPF0337 family)
VVGSGKYSLGATNVAIGKFAGDATLHEDGKAEKVDGVPQNASGSVTS